MTKLSLLSAALAISTLAALPALAQGTPPASVGGTVQMQDGTAGSDAKTGAKAEVKPQAKDQATKDKTAAKKPHEQVAQHPESSAKSDATVKTESK